jgi:hypothetical protein
VADIAEKLNHIIPALQGVVRQNDIEVAFSNIQVRMDYIAKYTAQLDVPNHDSLNHLEDVCRDIATDINLVINMGGLSGMLQSAPAFTLWCQATTLAGRARWELIPQQDRPPRPESCYDDPFHTRILRRYIDYASKVALEMPLLQREFDAIPKVHFPQDPMPERTWRFDMATQQFVPFEFPIQETYPLPQGRPNIFRFGLTQEALPTRALFSLYHRTTSFGNVTELGHWEWGHNSAMFRWNSPLWEDTTLRDAADHKYIWLNERSAELAANLKEFQDYQKVRDTFLQMNETPEEWR